MSVCCNILHAFKLSGSSERPAYPGFMVIKTAQVGFSLSSVPSNSSISAWAEIPIGKKRPDICIQTYLTPLTSSNASPD